MQSLSVKYRPQNFEDVCGQNSIIKILKKQIETNTFVNSYLFSGTSGSGKTTCARIFASNINNGLGTPIEIDAASNNSVDNVRAIVKSANERSLNSVYKVYIIDEAHALSNQAWQAFLKCIEEPPMYTIFIFCTTDPQKIPDTILNRVMRFNFTRIGSDKIKARLEYICIQEGFTNFNESVDYISKICHGGMRDAISLLDKASNYDKNLVIDNVLSALGNYSYDIFAKLTNSIIDGNESVLLSTLFDLYNQGNDMRLFVEQYLRFCLDVNKYAIFKTCSVTQFPISFEKELINLTEFKDSSKYYGYVINTLLELKNMTKNDTDIFSTIEVMLLRICRCQ